MSREDRLSSQVLKYDMKLWKEQSKRKQWVLKMRQPVDTGETVADVQGLLGNKLQVTEATGSQFRSMSAFGVIYRF